MSLEFKATDGKPEVISAAISIDREIESANSIWEYLDSVHHRYAETADGRGELGQMTRAAEFITGRGRHSTHESVYSFINGELLGQALLEKRGASEKLRSSLAQGYMSRLEAESLMMSSSQESEQERFERLEEMALEAQEQLASGFTPSITNIAYEKFLRDIAHRFDSTSTQNRSYFGMGFRLIVEEFHRRTNEYNADADILNGQFDFMTGPDIEPLSTAKQAFNTALYDIRREYGPFDTSDPQEVRAARAAFGFMLNTYNESKELIKPGDFISVIGTYCVKTTAEVSSSYSASQSNMEVQGIFDGLTAIEAPSGRELRKFLTSSKEEKPELHGDTLIAPAIKLVFPSFITHAPGESAKSDYRPHLTAEIPLIYRRSNLNRINIERLG